MADNITYVRQPDGSQVAVSGLSSSDISSMVKSMSAKAGAQASSSSPVNKTPSASSRVAEMSASLVSGGGSSVGVSAAPARRESEEIQNRINRASAFVPERVAGYTDSRGVYVPPTYTVDPARSREVYRATDKDGFTIDYFGNRIAAPGGNPSTGVTSSGSFSDPLQQLLYDRLQKSDEDWKMTRSLMENQAQNAETDLVRRQDMAMGANTAALARMGALNSSVSGMSYLQRMENDFSRELNSLRIQNSANVIAAQRAFDDRNFELTSKLIERADQIQAAAAEAETRYIDNLIKMESLRKLGIENDQMEVDSFQKTLDRLSKAAIDPSQLPDGYLEHIDAALSLPSGTSAGLLEISRGDLQRKAAADQLDLMIKGQTYESGNIDIQSKLNELSLFSAKQASQLYETLSKIPFGQKVTIDGKTYYGASTNGMAFQSDEDGIVTAIIPNPYAEGGFIVESLGKLASSSRNLSLYDDGTQVWSVDTSAGVAKPVLISGQYGDATPPGMEVGDKGGQCGTYVRIKSGLTGIPNDKEGKLKLIDRRLNKDNIQGGDVFIQAIGPNGHVGFVQSVYTDQSGVTWIKTNESNYNGDERVVTRVVRADDPSIKGFRRPPRNPFAEFSGTGGEPVALQSKPIEKNDPLDALLPESILKRISAPIGTTYRTAYQNGWIIPPEKADESVNYTMVTEDDPNNPGQKLVYGYNPKNNTLVATMPAPSGPSGPGPSVPTPQGGQQVVLRSKNEAAKPVDLKAIQEQQAKFPNAGIVFGDTEADIARKTQGVKPVVAEEAKETAAQKNYRNTIDAVSMDITNIEALMKDVNLGLSGVGWQEFKGSPVGSAFFDQDTAYTQLKSALSSLRLNYSRYLSGGRNAPSNEVIQKQLDSIIPEIGKDQDVEMRSKLSIIKNTIQAAKNGLASSSQSTPSSESVSTSDKVMVVSPSGQRGFIPRQQLNDALSKGYRITQ